MTVPAKGIEADLDVNAILARQRDDVVLLLGSGGHLHNGLARRLSRENGLSEQYVGEGVSGIRTRTNHGTL
jgi:hypothetical protein